MQQGGGTIRINGQEYAVGLFWQLAGAGVRLDKQARQVARQTNADLFVVRPLGSAAPQFGLGATVEGHRAGLPAAAAGIAAQLTGSAVAVFRTDGGYWYVALRDDTILAEGDILFHDEDQARERLLRDLDTGDYQTVIAPPEFGIALGDAPPAEELLANLKAASPELRLVNPPLKPFLIGGAIVAGLLMLAGGYMAWSKFMEQYNAQQEAANKPLPPAVPKVVEAPKLIPKREVAKPPQPWHEQPLAGDFFSGCETTASGLSVPGPGFALDTAACSGVSAAMTWRSDGATPPTYIMRWAETAMAPTKVSVNNDGSSASASRVFDPMPAKRPVQLTTSLWEPLAIRKLLWSQFLERSQPISITHEDGEPPLPPEEDPARVPRTPVTKFSFENWMPPSVWSQTLNSIPGLVINNADYNFATSTWKVSGTIYERSDLYENPRSSSK